MPPENTEARFTELFRSMETLRSQMATTVAATNGTSVGITRIENILSGGNTPREGLLTRFELLKDTMDRIESRLGELCEVENRLARIEKRMEDRMQVVEKRSARHSFNLRIINWLGATIATAVIGIVALAGWKLLTMADRIEKVVERDSDSRPQRGAP